MADNWMGEDQAHSYGSQARAPVRCRSVAVAVMLRARVGADVLY